MRAGDSLAILHLPCQQHRVVFACVAFAAWYAHGRVDVPRGTALPAPTWDDRSSLGVASVGPQRGPSDLTRHGSPQSRVSGMKGPD
jgi:hypothetical protein